MVTTGQPPQDDWEARGSEEYSFDWDVDQYHPATDLSFIESGTEPAISELRSDALSRLAESFARTRYRIIDCGHCDSGGDKRPLVTRHSFEVRFSCGVDASVVYRAGVPGPEPKEDRVTQKFLRRYTRGDGDYDVLSALFGPRGRPYAEGHVVVGHDKLPQAMTRNTAELFLAVLTVLGSDFEAFYNGVAPGIGKLHAQFLKRVAPVFNVSQIEAWPLFALRETLSTIPDAAGWIEERINGFAPHKKCDFLFRHDVVENKSAFTIVCIPRAEGRMKPQELGVGDDFGTFGVLEVAGYFLSIRTEQGYRRLQENPGLYEQALRELGSPR